MNYDDEAEVTRFVWQNYQSLMTDFERRVELAINARFKASHTSPAMAQVLNEKWGRVADPEIETALADGAEAFRRRVCHRVLREYSAELYINHCPKCNRVVRTPKAKQCFWCGYDWHATV
jgi:tRNA U34 2-thiouridine synthase MnmA/TrmU